MFQTLHLVFHRPLLWRSGVNYVLEYGVTVFVRIYMSLISRHDFLMRSASWCAKPRTSVVETPKSGG